MSNKIEIFNHEQFGEVRTVYNKENDEIWFVGKDITKNLEYQNGSRDINRHVDEEDRITIPIFDGTQNRNTICINESGMYSLILRSNLPSAREFKKWVTSEVLPSIRKHGTYMTDNTIEELIQSPDMIIGLATTLKEEREKKRLLEEELKQKEPTYRFGAQLEVAEDLHDLGYISTVLQQNGVKLGKNNLMKWLRDNGYLIKSGDRKNDPTQRSIDLKILELQTKTYVEDINGVPRYRVSKKSVVTPKGVKYLVDKIIEEENNKAENLIQLELQ